MRFKFLILTILWGGMACGSEEPGALPEPEGTADVRVSTAVAASPVESFPATVAAERTADVATRMSGTVEEVTVEVGSAVTAGEPLVRLDDRDVEARVNAAEARAELARRSFRRIEAVHADGAASDQELDEARAAMEGAEAAARDARAQLRYTVATAPFDGFVAARMADPGDLAAPGRPLLTVVGRSGLKVEADLPGELAGTVERGMAVRVRIPGAGTDAPARITRVVPALAPGTRRFRIEAVFEPALAAEGPVLPGAYARIVLDRAGAVSRWIPADAVVRKGQLTGAFTVEGDEIRLRWLRLGQERDDAVEVLAGPAGELTVVRRPAPTLRDGQPVGEVDRIEWSGPSNGPGTAAETGAGGAGR